MSEMTKEQTETVAVLRRDVRELEDRLVELGRETVESMLDAWRARIDNLQLHAELGRMDADDEVGASIAGAERVWADARRRLLAAGDEAADVRAVLAEGVGAARADLQAAVDLARERIEAARG